MIAQKTTKQKKTFASTVEDVILDVFLSMHSNKKESTNTSLYIKDHQYKESPNTTQINVFDLIYKLSPFNYLTQVLIKEVVEIINTAKTPITWINIGIGKGLLEETFIQFLDKQKLDHLQIIGIDIDPTSLDSAKKRLSQKVQFNPICSHIEKFKLKEWISLKTIAKYPICIGSILTLHHIKTIKERKDVIEKTQAFLKPKNMLLMEADADHFTKNYTQRIHNCRNHFGAVFEIIKKQYLEGTYSKEECNLLMHVFFKREIVDILQRHEEHRTEKHQPLKIWKDYMTSTGMKLKKISSDQQVPKEINIINKDILTTKLGKTGILGLIKACNE